MLHALLTWCLFAAVFGAGLFNAIGTPATQSDFVRWSYPAWWCRVTGGLEMATAVLIAVPVSCGAGLILGAVIVAAAILTFVRRSDFTHLVPLGVFVALLALV